MNHVKIKDDDKELVCTCGGKLKMASQKWCLDKDRPKSYGINIYVCNLCVNSTHKTYNLGKY